MDLNMLIIGELEKQAQVLSEANERLAAKLKDAQEYNKYLERENLDLLKRYEQSLKTADGLKKTLRYFEVKLEKAEDEIEKLSREKEEVSLEKAIKRLVLEIIDEKEVGF